MKIIFQLLIHRFFLIFLFLLKTPIFFSYKTYKTYKKHKLLKIKTNIFSKGFFRVKFP
nr:MAG TPA: hypothetical protein [Caudoviricetes sp.]